MSDALVATLASLALGAGTLLLNYMRERMAKRMTEAERRLDALEAWRGS